jgi:hypothetical protein
MRIWQVTKEENGSLKMRNKLVPGAKKLAAQKGRPWLLQFFHLVSQSPFNKNAMLHFGITLSKPTSLHFILHSLFVQLKYSLLFEEGKKGTSIF